jgi:hypothetical protein
MGTAHPEVAVQGERGLAPESQRPAATVLAENGHDLLVQIEVLKQDRRTLRPTHPRVEEQADDRRITASGEVRE